MYLETLKSPSRGGSDYINTNCPSARPLVSDARSPTNRLGYIHTYYFLRHHLYRPPQRRPPALQDDGRLVVVLGQQCLGRADREGDRQ